MVETAPQAFGERLQFALDKRTGGPGNVADLAKATGVSYQGAKKWLDASLPTLSAVYAVKAARYLKVNVSWLVLGEGPRLLDASVEPEVVWPFEDIEKETYDRLSPTQKGAAQKAMRDEIEKIELAAARRANDRAA